MKRTALKSNHFSNQCTFTPLAPTHFNPFLYNNDSFYANFFRMSSANTNGSFNSLLDNVNLEQSQNFDDLAASTNNGSVKLDEGVDTEFQYHSMLTSRTYLKVNVSLFSLYFYLIN